MLAFTGAIQWQYAPSIESAQSVTHQNLFILSSHSVEDVLEMGLR